MAQSKLLVCNMNSTGHTDYDMQISKHIGSDYRTTYKKSHAWIPTFAQTFDNRVVKKLSPIKPQILNDELYQTDYNRTFPFRTSSMNPNHLPKPPACDTVKYMTNFEQRIFQNPPHPIDARTEFRSNYTMKQGDSHDRIVSPPNPFNICRVRAIGRDEQTPLRPDQPGFMKHLDIYLTTSRAHFIPYDERIQRGIASKDIVTFYDSSGVPRGGKGYGPRKDTKIERICKTRPDKQCRSSNTMQTIPHRGFKSEYGERYQPQTKYKMSPFGDLQAIGTFPVITKVSPWQTLAAPAMYCTEYCHLGTGRPVNASVEITPVPKLYKHNIGCNNN